MANITRAAVIILGMHRSGTSALAGAAVRLGLAPPKTLLLANADNPTGFHESVPVADLNHLILNAVGRNWYHCLSFDPDMLDAAARAAALESCTAILRKEFADEPAFVVKDPLLCLTLPIWLPALRDVGAAVSVLLAVRHPDEVARSVFVRDGLPESYTASVWLHYMLHAERMTRGFPRAVVTYTDLLDDWRRCMTRAGHIAHIAWPRPSSLFQYDSDDVVTRSLRHHIAAANSVSVGAPQFRDLMNEAWLALCELADNPGSPRIYQRLDDVRSRFAIQCSTSGQ
jgi:hypothetical protein